MIVAAAAGVVLRSYSCIGVIVLLCPTYFRFNSLRLSALEMLRGSSSRSSRDSLNFSSSINNSGNGNSSISSCSSSNQQQHLWSEENGGQKPVSADPKVTAGGRFLLWFSVSPETPYLCPTLRGRHINALRRFSSQSTLPPALATARRRTHLRK